MSLFAIKTDRQTDRQTSISTLTNTITCSFPFNLQTQTATLLRSQYSTLNPRHFRNQNNTPAFVIQPIMPFLYETTSCHPTSSTTLSSTKRFSQHSNMPFNLFRRNSRRNSTLGRTFSVMSKSSKNSVPTSVTPTPLPTTNLAPATRRPGKFLAPWSSNMQSLTVDQRNLPQ